MRLQVLRIVGTLLCSVLQDHDPRIQVRRSEAGTWEGVSRCHRCERQLSTSTASPVAARLLFAPLQHR